MRTIVLTSLTLGLLSLAGCQSNKTACQVEAQITPFPDTHQHLVNIKVSHVNPSGNHELANLSTMAAEGKEGKMNVEIQNDTSINCSFLIDQDNSSTSVSLSKNGKVFWSSEQTTTTNSEDQTNMTSLGKISRSKHDEDVIEALEKRLKTEDSEMRM